MATPQADEGKALRGSTPIFDHERALASVQEGWRRAGFLRRWDGDAAARGAAPMLLLADFPICDVNPRAHDGSLSRRSRCLGLDALASARCNH